MVFCPASDSYSTNGGRGFALLFSSWLIRDASTYAAACACVFLLGAARRLLGAVRVELLAANGAAAAASVARSAAHRAGSLTEPLTDAAGKAAPPPALRRWLTSAALARRPLALLAVDATLVAASLYLAYINMLIAMVYDAGLIASLVAGEAVMYAALRALALTADVPRHIASQDLSCCDAGAACG